MRISVTAPVIPACAAWAFSAAAEALRAARIAAVSWAATRSAAARAPILPSACWAMASAAFVPASATAVAEFWWTVTASAADLLSRGGPVPGRVELVGEVSGFVGDRVDPERARGDLLVSGLGGLGRGAGQLLLGGDLALQPGHGLPQAGPGVGAALQIGRGLGGGRGRLASIRVREFRRLHRAGCRPAGPGDTSLDSRLIPASIGSTVAVIAAAAGASVAVCVAALVTRSPASRMLRSRPRISAGPRSRVSPAVSSAIEVGGISRATMCS